MKTKLMMILVMLLVGASGAWAEEATVTVKGMVCSFCAQGLKKTFGSRPQIQSVDVDLEEKKVKLVFKDGEALSDEAISASIKDAGFDVLKIERRKDHE